MFFPIFAEYDNCNRLMHMKSNKTYSSAVTSERIGDAFRKMVTDKKTVQSYIRENGTIEGFRDETIIFAKPL